MNYRLLVSSVLCCVCLFCNVAIKGQNTVKDSRYMMEFDRAVELFNHGKYDASNKVFDDFVREYGDVANDMQMASIAYYNAIGAVKTNKNNAPQLVMSFIDDYPSDLRANYAWFCLGNYYFDKGKSSYKNALNAYDQVDERKLAKSDKDQYWFNLAMCYYKDGNYEKAQPIFSRLIDEGNRYYTDALYYYSFIAYNNGNYGTALEGFLKLVDDERYNEGLDYVIAQIYYEQRDLEKLVDVGNRILKSREGKKKLSSDIRAKNALVERMLGELYFRNNDYSNALKNMQMYVEDSKKIERYEQWMMGYCCYKMEKYDNAMDHLQKVVSGKDSLDYNAQYHIGICYLKSGNKTFAQKAFYSAYQLAFDQVSKENALFNYAKLSYELSSDPYKSAMVALQEYLDAYPESDKSDEAKELLMQLLVMTKSYANAVSILNSMKFKKVDVMMLEQKLCYYYGVELFNAGKYQLAMNMFERSSDMPFYPEISAKAAYWEGECYYMTKKYDEAISKYDDFLDNSGSKKSSYYAKGLYGKGYCYFKKKDYVKALATFKKMITLPEVQKDRAVYYNAVLRLADCLQQNKNYSEAIAYYDKCYKAGVGDSDYALYQQALCYGAMGQFENKAKTLRQFISSFDKSVYLASVCYELGMTNLIQNKNKEAVADFEKVVKTFPNSVYASRALLKQGLIYYNESDNANALLKLKSVVSNYGGTPEATEALAIISNIYVELNDINTFADYVKAVPNAKFGEKDRDSLLFVSAEKRYLSGDCDGAKSGLEAYLNGNNGKFAINASFYLGDCLFMSGKYDEALSRLEFVIKNPQSIFSESAYLKAATILSFNKELSNIKTALKYYEELEKLASNKTNVLAAEVGIMRCAYLIEDYEKSSVYAKRLMSNDKVTEELLVEAHFVLGSCAYIAGNKKVAMSEFKITSQLSKGEFGAEAAYLIAVIQFVDKKYTDAEKSAFNVINNYPDYEYWRAKSFILLADVYKEMGNMFQAKETLQSVIDNCEIEELREEAKSKITN